MSDNTPYPMNEILAAATSWPDVVSMAISLSACCFITYIMFR